MFARIVDIAYHLPERRLTNLQLAEEYPDWTASKIEEKTGIVERRVAATDECSSDLAVHAARALFDRGCCSPNDIDYVIFCTQSPDYILPTTACTIQSRLGISTKCGAIDFNLGCSGYVAGLGLAKGLIESGQANRVLLLTGETYSKFISHGDRSVRTIFGDAGAATVIEAHDADGPLIGPFVYGTDGSGAKHLIIPTGGQRTPRDAVSCIPAVRENGNVRSDDNLYMNGAEIFTFTLRTIPNCVYELLSEADLKVEDVNHFVFHQANSYMLEHLRKKCGIPESKFVVNLRNVGNTVSCSIPIALADIVQAGRIKCGDKIALVGFGVGFSWAAALITWG